jgi:tetratricopeptide (TPR) repeat protein
MRFGDDPNVSGTVLVSEGVVDGVDIPGKQNPYAQFVSVQPDAVIDRGVYVYNGQFSLGPPAALEHVRAAQNFASQQNFSEALREARIAEKLDPGNAEAHTVIGDALTAMGDRASAQSEYLAALHSSELDPVFQKDLLAQLMEKTRR